MEFLYLSPDPWNYHILARIHGIFRFEPGSTEFLDLNPDPWNF